MTITLRPYQQDVVDDVRAHIAAGSQAPLVVLPTGGGKTVIFCHISERAVARGSRVCVLVHRKELLDQARASMRALGIHAGAIAPGHMWQPTLPVQVASVQTLVRRLHILDASGWAPDVLVIDEGHHASAGSWMQVMEHWQDRCRVMLGVTATPCRMDGKGLGDVYDSMILGPQIRDLIDDGHLARPITFAPPMAMDLSGVKTRMGDYAKAEVADRADKPKVTGDAISHYRRILDGAPSIAFCVSVAHAQHVAEEFRAAGYVSASLDGNMDATTRAALIADLGRGAINVLTSCDIISEGTDIPIVTGAIMLRPTQSLGLYIQQAGRVLRTAPGKTHAVILDHAGNCHRHGLIDQERAWTLTGSVAKTSKSSNDNEPPPPITCTECYAQIPPPFPILCSVCGAKLIRGKDRMDALEVVDDDLVEVDPERHRSALSMIADQLKTQKPAPLPRAERIAEELAATTYPQLFALARKRGYTNPQGWAMAKLTGRKRSAG